MPVRVIATTRILIVPVLLALTAVSGWSADEVKLTIDQVPAPVKTAILAAAGTATITEIEQETEDGAVVYTAEWLDADGKTEVEVTIAADGKLLKTEREAAEADDADEKPAETPAATAAPAK